MYIEIYLRIYKYLGDGSCRPERRSQVRRRSPGRPVWVSTSTVSEPSWEGPCPPRLPPSRPPPPPCLFLSSYSYVLRPHRPPSSPTTYKGDPWDTERTTDSDPLHTTYKQLTHLYLTCKRVPPETSTKPTSPEGTDTEFTLKAKVMCGEPQGTTGEAKDVRTRYINVGLHTHLSTIGWGATLFFLGTGSKIPYKGEWLQNCLLDLPTSSPVSYFF